jgi:hypothetical protein
LSGISFFIVKTRSGSYQRTLLSGVAIPARDYIGWTLFQPVWTGRPVQYCIVHTVQLQMHGKVYALHFCMNVISYFIAQIYTTIYMGAVHKHCTSTNGQNLQKFCVPKDSIVSKTKSKYIKNYTLSFTKNYCFFGRATTPLKRKFFHFLTLTNDRENYPT